MTRVWLLLPVVLLAVLGAAPASGQALTADALTVDALLPSQSSIGRTAPLTLTFSRPPTAEDGRPVIFFGTMDLTALFVADGTTWRYVPDLLPLPAGAHDLVVYLNHDDAPWQELGRFPVQVRLAGDFERANWTHGLTLTNEGQVAEQQMPESLPERRVYQDVAGQLSLRAEAERRGLVAQGETEVVGVSYQNEALRFRELAEAAPRVDLSQYLVALQRGPVTWQVGHVAHGRHRHLVNRFGSRGTTLGLTTPSGVDVSVAALNGSRIVGWRNPLGLNEPDHRILSGTAGLEVVPERPGAFRIEASYLVGSVLPRTGFNQGGIVDAEQSRGAAARIRTALLGGRLRAEGGLAGSRFDHPDDPTLSQGADVVPVEEERRYAHYLDVTAGLLQNKLLAPRWPATLSLAYRRERVDPLYQTVAAFVQPDQVQNAVEVQAQLGPLAAQGAYTRARDNLDAIPSVLTTHTRRQDVRLGLPVGALLGATPPPGARLLPALAYSYARTHQFGAGIPVDGGFSASHVPDQVNRLHDIGADWRLGKGQLGYRYSTSAQDNRQEGREDADFANRMHRVMIGARPGRFLDVSVDVSFERAESLGDARVEHTHRLGLSATVRPTAALTLSGQYAPVRMEDAEATSLRTTLSLRLEAAYAFQVAAAAQLPLRGQAFVRYARQEAASRDLVVGLDTERHSYTVNTGVSLTLF